MKIGDVRVSLIDGREWRVSGMGDVAVCLCIAYADTRDAVIARLAALRCIERRIAWWVAAVAVQSEQPGPEVTGFDQRRRADMERNAKEMCPAWPKGHDATLEADLVFMAPRLSAVAKLPPMPPRVVVKVDSEWDD